MVVLNRWFEETSMLFFFPQAELKLKIIIDKKIINNPLELI